MPNNDRQVFRYLSEDETTPVEIDYFTYAIYTVEKYEWFTHVENETGKPPTQQEIDRWISQITPFRYGNMREKAAQLFDEAARRYLHPEIERQKEAAVRESILSEVRAAGAFWKQLTVALITAVLAPIIIGGVIAAVLTYDRIMPAATDIQNRLRGSQTETPAR
jgi:hypothetical protein